MSQQVADASAEPVASLMDQIRSGLATYLRVPEGSISIPENVDKYHDKNAPTKSDPALEEVFRLMWALNERGLSDQQIGNTSLRRRPLTTALDQILEDITSQMRGVPLQYTELGPEPVKTKYIIGRLQQRGLDIQQYNGVDINPASRETMRRELAEFIPKERFSYHRTLFEELGQSPYKLPGVRNLVTMLGFEEGNEHPAAINRMLDRILDPGDLFLSEMQILSDGGWHPIFNFYQNDLMRRFSKIALERSRPHTDSEYGVYLVPLSLGTDGAPTMAAVTAERIRESQSDTDSIFVTNYCLKFALNEYRHVREGSGRLKVLSQRTTADGSVKQTLKFTADKLDIGDLHQIVDGPNGLRYHVAAAEGSNSTFRNGEVTMYTERLEGKLFGLIPIVFDPENEPSVDLPIAHFTDVFVTQAGQFGGELTMPGMHQYMTET
jgi:hypothetical protein